MVVELIQRYKWSLLFATILSTLSALFSIGVMVMLNGEISALREGVDNVLRNVAIFALALAGLGAFGIFSQYILSCLSAGFTSRMRDYMVRNVLNTDYEGIERLGGHRIYATLTSDIRNLAAGFSLLPHLAYNISVVLLCLGYMAYNSWQLFSFVFVFLALAIGFAQLLMNRGMRLLKILRETDDNLFGSFKSLVEGGKELNINVNRKYYFYQDIVAPQVEEIKNKTVKTEFNFIIIHNWTNVILFIVMGAIVFLSQAVFTQVSVEVVTGFLLIMIYLVGPISSLMDMYSVVAAGFVAHRKINSLKLSTNGMDSERWDNRDHANVTTLKQWNCLSVRNLTYHYESEAGESYHFGIGPISMDIQQGEVIFITGGNGSGKSTFIKTLVGLYTASAGEIYLDNIKVDLSQNREWYCQHFSIIFSDFHLFDYALDRHGNPADDALINEHLKKLKLDDKVSSHNGVISSLSLSHGQKKRLALLLSYLEDAPIYIFDEWAADQDPYFRKYFYHTLLPELKAQGKTVIAITHDDAYFHTADRMFKFENGQLVDRLDYEDDLAEPVEWLKST
ncbi:cyclic peptide export ABC transporter [Gynuella sp.]|uniref:cyclic peptide export ABC transporter n=1 Tax=Gynuella sp. TaxID=2969146 RepID=UPI003D122891